MQHKVFVLRHQKFTFEECGDDEWQWIPCESVQYEIFINAEDVKNRRQDLKKECNHGEYIINVEEAVETMEFYEV